jgi:hypothetical protein
VPERQCCKTRTFGKFGVDLSFVIENREDPGAQSGPLENLSDRLAASGATDVADGGCM